MIDLLGHMQPDSRLRRDVLGLTFPSAVGLGAGIDVRTTALRALAHFGFGFLEVGPVTRQPIRAIREVERDIARQGLWFPDPQANDGLDALLAALVRAGSPPLPVMARLAAPFGTPPDQAAADCGAMAVALAPHVQLFALSTLLNAAAEVWPIDRWADHVRAVRQATPAPLLVVVPPDLDPARADELLRPVLAEELIRGVVVSGGVEAAGGGHARLDRGGAGGTTGAPAAPVLEQPADNHRFRWRP